MKKKNIIYSIYFYLYIFLLYIVTSCASYEQFKYITEEFEIPTKVFKATYNQTWEAVLNVMSAYDMPTKDQVAGVIKTSWKDNTLELNFADSFGDNDTIRRARFKVIVNVAKGYKGDKEVTKVTIFKRQLVEQDMLQGEKEIPSDGIFEKTLLYRIERVIANDNKLKEIEDAINKEAEAKIEEF